MLEAKPPKINQSTKEFSIMIDYSLKYYFTYSIIIFFELPWHDGEEHRKLLHLVVDLYKTVDGKQLTSGTILEWWSNDLKYKKTLYMSL